MAKTKSVFVCSQCAYESAKWYGQCPSCHEWNTLEEELRMANKSAAKNSISKSRDVKAVLLSEISDDARTRYQTKINEFDRVLGGGIVQGSLVLLSGDPGIGKSTILLQVCKSLAEQINVLYVSGEESAQQIKLRAQRLDVIAPHLHIMSETDLGSVLHYIQTEKPQLVIIDSIQTMTIDELSSSAGSITQVRECTNMLMRTAKELNISILLVGHVNKDGNIAGPKVLEHIVDAVLYFEGERNLAYRMLRAVKNRYGSTNEIGVFEMLDTGLKEVENPSMMLLSGRPENTPGTCVACVMEGTRPLLAEVQGLVSSSGFGNPRRMAAGFDYNRMSMLLAVLEKRAGYHFTNMDAYINVVGGLRLDEPATDLPVAIALISSLKDKAVKENTIAFGEIGLAGEIRSVSHAEQRVLEAARLGFKICILPKHNLQTLSSKAKKAMTFYGVKTVREASILTLDEI